MCIFGQLKDDICQSLVYTNNTVSGFDEAARLELISYPKPYLPPSRAQGTLASLILRSVSSAIISIRLPFSNPQSAIQGCFVTFAGRPPFAFTSTFSGGLR